MIVHTAALWSSTWIQSRTFCACAVQLRPDAAEHVGDLARDELLDVLVRAVVVRAVRDRGVDAERAHPRPHQQVRAGLGRAVRAGRVVRRARGELRRVVELEVAVHLVGGDVVQPHAVPPHRLEDGERADQVGVHERRRVAQRVVVVRLGGEVDDDVGWPDELRRRAGASAMSPRTKRIRSRTGVQARLVRRVGQRVQHRDLDVGPLRRSCGGRSWRR